ncbi:hypothetical protein FAM09_14595 [Niastella caeni]|uniref:Uncharacterized protein n=1 Tax=Niastella caeni TaxID=2569763 RepID=A0A4S8HWU1_9BACT|nr:hypothetical protein [Niastella caeni]THU39721.1 hypothetical protein FAM09_14595 [Niastella caeni]
MYKWWTILFLIGILGQTFSKSLIVLNFRMNQKAIAANLCENRTKPRSCCQGKCYLGKQLNKDENSQNTPLNGGPGFKFEVLLYSEKKARIHHLVYKDKPVHVSRYTDPISQKVIDAVFHPPQV